MSHAHAKVSAWNREEDGSYRAEQDGWTLEVRWGNATTSRRRGFTWHIEQAAGPSADSDDVFEEMEIAMAEAEAAARKGIEVEVEDA